MKKKYDVIIVGAGPAGSLAAKSAAEQGADVLVLEKDDDIGIPVRCAEGAGEIGLKVVLDEIKPEWVSQWTKGIQLVAPNNEVVVYDQMPRGVVLNRKVFDFDLARMAAEAGAEIRTKAFVNGLLFENDAVVGVKVKSLAQTYEIAAKVVIGADGVEARVGRWAGIRQHFKMCDVETCAQVTAANIDLDHEYCHFYFGEEKAPGGYVWAFPKGSRIFNIGLGLGGDCAGEHSSLDYLNDFMNAYFPNAAILTTVVGGVPCAPALKKMTGNGVMIVGDAANQVNPISGGGIVRGMLAGKIAGRVAAEAIQKGDVSEKALSQYSREWFKGEGKTHKFLYKIKQGIYNLSNDSLNNTAKVLNNLPPEERTVLTLFKSALRNKPSLILDVIKAFA